MAVQTTTWREIEIPRGMEEAAVEYNLGAQESKLPHTRDGGRTHSRRMIRYTCRKKWKEDNLGTYRLVSFTSVAGKMMKYAFFEALSGQNE